MTYGQIAKLCGSPRAARQVVRILHSMSKTHRLPWHRVINAQGKIGMSDDGSFQEQRFRLEQEGIEFSRENLIDLDRYQFHPDTDESPDDLL
ncbi:methylated-DNA-protein-cysteine methyltransferase-like protein [Tumebacillus sp. BK434]|nr:methylated-DNA-protein-cysteine methyltransferase-like protein [Tumebacillus sp. BK434]